MNYTVTFTQHHTYCVNANSEEEAMNQAHREFLMDMYTPAANTIYDDVEVICNEEEEDDE